MLGIYYAHAVRMIMCIMRTPCARHAHGAVRSGTYYIISSQKYF